MSIEYLLDANETGFWLRKKAEGLMDDGKTIIDGFYYPGRPYKTLRQLCSLMKTIESQKEKGQPHMKVNVGYKIIEAVEEDTIFKQKDVLLKLLKQYLVKEKV